MASIGMLQQLAGPPLMAWLSDLHRLASGPPYIRGSTQGLMALLDRAYPFLSQNEFLGFDSVIGLVRW